MTACARTCRCSPESAWMCFSRLRIASVSDSPLLSASWPVEDSIMPSSASMNSASLLYGFVIAGAAD